MMKNKLGMISDEDQDKQMMSDLFKLMHKNQADYTNTFRYLINGTLKKNYSMILILLFGKQNGKKDYLKSKE